MAKSTYPIKKSKKTKKEGMSTELTSPLLTHSTPTTITISGLPASTWVSNVVSASLGLLVFVGAPFIVNKTGNTTLASIMTVCPAGIIMSLFISEKDFGVLIRDLIISIVFIELANFLVYYLFYYAKWPAVHIITLVIVLWLLACLIAYFFY
jgi:hypothetical protein